MRNLGGLPSRRMHTLFVPLRHNLLNSQGPHETVTRRAMGVAAQGRLTCCLCLHGHLFSDISVGQYQPCLGSLLSW